MADRVVLPVAPEQRALLGQALADAVFYRDPPLECPACEEFGDLCERCATGLAQARAYLELCRMLGLEAQ
jgi:hypothetical protein